MANKPLITETGIPHWLQSPKKDRGDLYTEYTWQTTLERLSGGETLRSICSDDTMPEYKKFLRWIHNDPAREREYTLAQKLAAESTLDKHIDKLNDANDMTEIERLKLENGMVRWLVGVWNREKYGQKTQVDMNVNVDLSGALEAANRRLEGHSGTLIEGDFQQEP